MIYIQKIIIIRCSWKKVGDFFNLFLGLGHSTLRCSCVKSCVLEEYIAQNQKKIDILKKK